MQGQEHISAIAATAALAVPLPKTCDREGCSRAAVFSYVWEWGETGICCAEHMAELQQTAGNISRSIQCAPLQAAAPAPLQRDERARLMAAALVLEAELEETKTRGLDLYNDNTRLQQQIQTLTLRDAEAQAQVKDANAKAIELAAKLDERNREHGGLVDELGRLRVLVSRPNPDVSALSEKASKAEAALAARDTELRSALGTLESTRSELRVAESTISELKSEVSRLRELVGDAQPGSDRTEVGLTPEG